MNKIFKMAIIPVLLGLISCNISNPDTIAKNIKIADKHSLNLSFRLKAVSRVKSFEAYLTTNFNDPFASGANPFGDNVRTKANVGPVSTDINFPDVPAGGPYFAVIAAFDDVIENPERKNITQIDKTILSNAKNWSRSSNSVTISSVPLFSDKSDGLKVNMKLAPVNSIGFTIAPKDGASTSLPITISP